jgi:hypothetical protein
MSERHDDPDTPRDGAPRRVRARNHGTWRMIVATTFMSLLALGVTSTALRAIAQESPSPPAPPSSQPPPAAAPGDAPASVSKEQAAAEDPTLQEETTRRAADPALADELPPDLRESADNNISFPVDI